MTREEAVEVYNGLINEKIKAAFEFFAPELRESDDERIRKELVEKISNLACGCFISQEQKQNFIAYLEKQKEQKPWKVGANAYFTPEQKPAEWSEEDKDMLNSCISSIEEAKENRYAYKETDGDTSYDHEIAWLKSLRPSWKPSGEQMMALRRAVNKLSNSDIADSVRLSIMHDNLKKLM